MTSNSGTSLDFITWPPTQQATVQEYIKGAINSLLTRLVTPEKLSSGECRGIIARYTAILEGNFIYWMTATYLSVQSPEAQAIIKDNLREEVQDNHPGMLRRFAVAAHATSTDADRTAIERNLQNVREFVARMSRLEIVLMMAFFEGFIAKFMPYLAELASRQGSVEHEYTDVHGVVDVAHEQGLFHAFAAEAALTQDLQWEEELLEGVDVLGKLLESVIDAPVLHPGYSRQL